MQKLGHRINRGKSWEKNRRHQRARSTIEKTSDRQDKKISSRRIIIRGEPLIRNRGKNTIPFDFLFYLPLNVLNHSTRVWMKKYTWFPGQLTEEKNSRWKEKNKNHFCIFSVGKDRKGNLSTIRNQHHRSKTRAHDIRQYSEDHHCKKFAKTQSNCAALS